MTVDGTQPTDQSSTRLSQAELDRKAREAGTNPLAATALFNPDNFFTAMRNAFDPKMAGSTPGMGGLAAMMGPLLQMFTGFLQNMGAQPSTPNAPGNTSPQVTTQPQLVMSQNYAPRGPTGMA